jgi:sensor histidine kinase YesM
MKIFHKLYPLFLAVIAFNIIRLVTDIPLHDSFWKGGFYHHSIELAVSIFAYYWFDFRARWLIKRKWFVRESRFDTVKEYAIVISYLLIFINLYLYLFQKTRLVYLGHPVTDFIIANVVNVPILTLYYVAIKMEKIATEYSEQLLQLEQMKVEKLETELKYLRAQYHPHFLFNALNTIYFRIDEQNVDAKNTVELLSGLLRYQLYNIEEKVYIFEEINFIKSYIQFQQLRTTKRLVINALFDDALNEQKIYPLIYQPFLESAFKYVGGDYRINLEMKFLDEQIIFYLGNSLPGQLQQTKKSNSGIGIENSRRRLALLYPDRHSLNIEQNEKSFSIELNITLTS